MRLSNIAIYDKSTIDFYNQGLGILSDAISSESTEAVQDNGNITYEMTLKYPINGVLADKLKLPNLIRAQESEDPNDFMIFEIYDYDEDDDGEMTVYAQALPYRVLRLPFNDEAKFATKYNNVQELFDDAIKRVTGFPTWFKINSDVKLASNLNFKNSQFENLGKLLEATMSLIDATVEYQWNQINILQSRGRDLSNIVLRDDKNTNGVKITGSYEKIINKVVPIIKNRNETTGEFEDGTHMGSVVTSKDPFKWIPYYAGVTAAFDSQEEANNYISSNKLDNPAITVDVTPLMVDEDLTQVHTFDRITAYSTKLKYQDTLQVTTRVFDQLNAEVVSFKMGSIKKDINSTTSYTLSSLASEIARAQNIARSAATSADGKNTNYYAEATPADPIEGDLWFHKIDGKDIMQQYINGEWTTIVKDGMGEEIQAYVDQKMLENDEVLAGLNTKLQDNDKALAGLNTKLQDNDEAMDKLHTDLESNTQIIKDNKQAIDDAMGKVNENLTQAQADVKKAVSDADQAVANAKSSADASGFATQTANAASDAANAAKQLATEVSNNFVPVKADANTAKANSTQAINDAAAAKGQAANALGQANTAIDNAADALDKFNNLQVGGRNYFLNSDFSQDETNWRDSNGVWFVSGEKCNGQKVMTATPTVAWTGGATNSFNQTMSAITNQQVTVSVWAKASKSGAKFHSEPNGGNGAFDTSLTNMWKRYSYVAQTNTVGTIHFMAVDVGTQYWISMPQVEIGNKVTDWSAATEDVQQQFTNIDGELASKVSQTTYNTLAGTVDTVNTLAKQNQSTISTLATSASVDAVSGRVTKAQSLAEQTANGLTFKADKSVVGTIDGTVKQQGIDLKAAQGELKLKMTQNDLTKGLNGYATQTWAQNQINLTANGINGTLSKKIEQKDLNGYATQTWAQNQMNLTANGLDAKLSQTQTQLDGISIGGRNYLEQSSTFKWQHLGEWHVDTEAYQGHAVLTGTQTVNYSRYGFSYTSLPFVNSDVVVSFYAKAAKSSRLHSEPHGVGGGSGATDFMLTTEWARYSYKAHVGSTRTIYWWASDANIQMWVTMPQVEIGTVVSDYHEAPEDTATYTDTKVAELKLTVDGFSTTFAKKTDLATTASNLKVTADGLNLLATATGKKGEKVTQVIADVNNIKTTMTGANGVTTRLQTLEGFQNTATSNITNLQTQQTTLAGQYTSLIESTDNKVRKPWFDDGKTGTWSGSNAVVAGPDSNVQKLTGHSKYLKLFNRDNYEGGVGGFSVTPGEVYYFSGYMGSWGTTYPVNVGLHFITETGPTSWSPATGFPANSKTPMSAITGSITVPAGVVRAQTWVQIDGPSGTDLGYAAISGLRISKSASSSQIAQLQDNIDQRVMVDGKIAAALSLSADGGGTVTIRGASLYVTAASHFDTASIQSAAIANLDAAKITSGSISSDRLVTTKLNADNITSGSIAAARIATTALSATNITSGTFDASKMTVKNINAGSITSGSIATERLATTKLNASNITTGSMNASLITAGSLNANLISGGTFNGHNMNITNINVNSLVGNKTAFVQSAWNDINSTVTINANGLIARHNDGSQTLINSSGLYHVEGSAQYHTNYLVYQTEVVLNNGVNNIRWVTLPAIFKGKNFTARVACSDTIGVVSDPSYFKLALLRIACSVQSKDTANGRVGLVGYSFHTNIDNLHQYQKAIKAVLTVTY